MKPKNFHEAIYRYLSEHYSEGQSFSRHDLLHLCKKCKVKHGAVGRTLIILENRGQIVPTGGVIPNGDKTRPC